ncbi:MAG: tyrosine-protein phosphatase [Clostridia bacterium]|nr:tyrosine-protein phosphatase [Clostridia bacterium]
MSRLMAFEKLNNTRDLGGMPTADGRRIRSGKLIRSGHLFASSEADRAALAALADAVVDFRTEKERREKPDPQLAGIAYHHLPILNDLTEGVTREREADEKAISLLMRDAGRAKGYMCGIYTGFVANAFSVEGYARFVRLLLAERDRALLWHCTAGKDRAGFASVIVEELLGVDRDAIKEDYLRTNEHLMQEVAALREMLRRRTGQVSEEAELAMGYMFGASEEYLDAAYSKADELYGGFEGFLEQGLRVTAEEKERLRHMYLE